MQADADKCDSTILSPAENALDESSAMKASLEGTQNEMPELNCEKSHSEAEGKSADLTDMSAQFAGSTALSGNVAFDEFTSMMLNNCTNNSALDSKVNPCTPTDFKNDPTCAPTFSNHLNSTPNNHQSQDKIWSLIDPEFNGSPFDSMNQNVSFSGT